MGLFDKLLHKKETCSKESIDTQAAPLTVCAPFSGKVIPIHDIPDPVFSEGIVGLGCGIEPEEETVYAPFDGVISQITETKHAIGITSTDGMELLIHIGIDTVDMNGKGFDVLATEGQQVKAGQPLLTFSLSEIQAADHPTTTAVLLTNHEDFSALNLMVIGQIQHGLAILKVSK